MAWTPLIESWFPARTIGAESLRERGASSALPPINFLHVWWARRPLTSARATVVASLLPAWPTADQAATDPAARRVLDGLEAEFGDETTYQSWFLTALGIMGDPVQGRAAISEAVAKAVKTKGNAYGYARAFTVTPDNDTVARIHRLAALRTADEVRQPVVLDMFAGGGSIPFEAARFGSRTIANELNPVATAILKGTVEYPPLLGSGFASTIRFWGRTWADRVKARLAEFFPVQHPEERNAFIWAHTVPCPSTGRPTPLVPDFWLARGKAGRDIAVRLDADRDTGRIDLSIVEGDDAAPWGDWSTYKRGTATSIWTGETFSTDFIRTQAKTGNMGNLLLAVSVTRSDVRGRQFRAPSDADREAVLAAEEAVANQASAWEINGLIPTEEVPAGHKTDEPRNVGLMKWSQMFAPRQLLSHAVAMEELLRVVHEASEVLPEREAKAVNLYLAFAMDKAVDYNGMLSSWDATRTKIRNVFDRHDFSFKWTFAEFDGARAILPWALNQVTDAYQGIAQLTRHQGDLYETERVAQVDVLRGSAADLPLEDESVDVIVTDPPYYDNVQYAEISDYFYVWQKRSLAPSFPELITLDLTDKQAEAVANPSLFTDVATSSGRGKNRTGKTASELANEHYERLLTLSFREAHRVLRPDGVMTVMFTHKRVDAWDTLGQALLEAGFALGSSWPVHTESEHALHQAKKNAANSTIMLSCTKRPSADPAYWDQVRPAVQAKARWAVEEFSKPEYGLSGIDLTLATFGPVLSVLSQHWPVYTGTLDDQGEPQMIRPDIALNIAREEVARAKKRGLLGGRDAEFDPITDWWLLAWSDFQAAQFPAGEALKLSLAVHLDLGDLVKVHKVAKSSSGNVEILTPAQRRTAGSIDPDQLSQSSMLDALHSLMVVYQDDGKTAAEAWLVRSGYREHPRFEDLFTMALRVVPRTRDAKGVWMRPEARTLEGLRASIFDHIPDPDIEVEAARRAEAERRAALFHAEKQMTLDGVGDDQLDFDDVASEDDEDE